MFSPPSIETSRLFAIFTDLSQEAASILKIV